VAVYGVGFALHSRFSSDGGTTWSQPTVIATRTFEAYPTWSGGSWQLVDARGSLLRFRTSSDGRHWTAPMVLWNTAGWEIEPVGAAVLESATVVPFIAYDEDFDADWMMVANN
jgi:hypothetical protein